MPFSDEDVIYVVVGRIDGSRNVDVTLYRSRKVKSPAGGESTQRFLALHGDLQDIAFQRMLKHSPIPVTHRS